jgi:dCMP deaminase
MKNELDYDRIEKMMDSMIGRRKGDNVYERPSWREYFFEVTDAIARRATCDRGRSGCIIVRDNQILVSGYVGSTPGLPHCDEAGHLITKMFNYDGTESEHCVRTIHAEMNAILQAAKMGIPLDGATMYCNMTPCRNCAMSIIRVGIKAVHCKKKYHRGQAAEEMFKQVGVELTFETEELEQYVRQK